MEIFVDLIELLIKAFFGLMYIYLASWMASSAFITVLKKELDNKIETLLKSKLDEKKKQ